MIPPRAYARARTYPKRARSRDSATFGNARRGSVNALNALCRLSGLIIALRRRARIVVVSHRLCEERRDLSLGFSRDNLNVSLDGRWDTMSVDISCFRSIPRRSDRQNHPRIAYGGICFLRVQLGLLPWNKTTRARARKLAFSPQVK